LVAVAQRTREIGLIKALGARRAELMRLFVAEAALLAGLGALFGLLLGQVAMALLAHLYPDFPLSAPFWAAPAAVLMALGAGVLFGWLPARKAAALDPIQALAGR
jgi:putative ABC transport system permease protein